MTKSGTGLIRLACSLGVVLPVLAIGVPQAKAATFTPLTLQNGWTNSPFGTRRAAAANISRVVQIEGAIATTRTNPAPFTLPSAFRPARVVFVPVDLCNATNGVLQIKPTGVVTVQAEGGAFSNAACFTSLEGVSYPVNPSGYTALTLQNGWFNSPFGTRSPAAEIVNSVVHLKGAIATSGANPVPFTLPSAFRPAHAVFVPVDLCDATHGSLQIEPTGVVTVEAEGGAFSNAACFTSSEGVSYPVNPSGYTALTLQNGWFNSPFGTRSPAAEIVNSVVDLKGAIATSGANPVPFTLPSAFRPAHAVFVPVDLCTSTNGSLQIEPTGVVTVRAQGGASSNAACFTSLEGVTFAK
jgi:hypothetical protein